jgi:integrative and conjugative element protein (TIGR02256 family)
MLDWSGLRDAPRVEPDALAAAKARAFASTVVARPELGVALVETRQIGDLSVVVLEIEVPVGQKPVNDIRKREPFLLVFGASDGLWPDVFALRPSFPTHVAHLNAPEPGWPPRLCLSVLPYDEVRRHWTTEFFVKLLRDWLSATARDVLHKADQPVEQFLVDTKRTLILPYRLDEDRLDPSTPWAGVAITPTLFRVTPQAEAQGPHAPIAFMSLIAPPRQHGAIAAPPATLADLCALVDCDGFSLLDEVDAQARRWIDARRREFTPVLLLQVPITRTAGGDPERYEVRAFALDTTVERLGIALGVLDAEQPAAALIRADDGRRDGTAVALEAWNVQTTLSRSMAARYNGESIEEVSYVAIGAGALGSQLLNDLTRGGMPPSAVVDKDRLFPHNLARHLLLRDAEGQNKAESVAHTLSSVFDGPPAIKAVVADAMTMDWDVLGGASVIVDLSASVAVARRLAIDAPGSARRISLYLNPSGTDLVMLAEDRDRTVPLDQLEMQYYWVIANDPAYAAHFRSEDGERYGGGCRDVSGRIKQTSLAVHAGTGAAGLRRAVADPMASAFAWRLEEETGEISRTALAVRPMQSLDVDGWTVFVSASLREDLILTRLSKLPNETGGVLIGALDMERRRAYLVGNVPGPRDSIECRTSYVRGSYGLEATIESLCARAGGNLTYVGEWHSHPEDATTEPSGDDWNVNAWVSEAMRDEGRPGIILIVGARDIRCIVGSSEKTLDLAA